MKKYGLIGYPLTHSFSKKYFVEKFTDEGLLDCSYENVEIKSIKDLPKWLKQEPELLGFNVTAPHKKSILPHLYEIDQEAVNAWAVNTVKITRMKSRVLLKGYNTDVYGFEKSIHSLLQDWHQKALIFGTGGAATAVKYALDKLGIESQLVSRTGKMEYLNYEDINTSILQDYKLLVNATPLGTYPKVEACPKIPYQDLSNKHLCYDLVYNPEQTVFLQKASKAGAKTQNGLEMLKFQAEKAWEIWNE